MSASRIKLQPGRSQSEIPQDTPNYPTILQALNFAADERPDRLALICEEKQVSFAQYRRAVAGVASTLSASAKRGDRVALIMANSIEMAIAVMGSYAASLQVAPLNPALTDRELTPLLDDIDPTVVLCSPQFFERTQNLTKDMVNIKVMMIGDGGIDPWDWVDDLASELPSQLPEPSDRCSMFFTGGTTGLPKGAEHIHSGNIAFCRKTISIWQFRYDKEIILNVAPMFHIWGHHFTLLFPLFSRATMVIVPQYQPDFVLDQLERHRVTIFAGGPAAIFLGLLGSEKMDGADITALQYSIAGGSPCPEGLLRQWKERTGNDILEGWGMSEGAPINNNPTHGIKKLLSTGLTPPETEVDIVDLETGTKLQPTGERGEIRVRGSQFAIGYRNRPEETAAAIRDGWLYTGDIGYFDEDGYLYLVDRKKELIIVGGYNVYPREIDEVLSNHPAVAEAAAVGAADDFLGEVVKAFVALKKGVEATPEELIEHCRNNLAKYKVPKEIRQLDELPKKGPGKINKLLLKELIAEA